MGTATNIGSGLVRGDLVAHVADRHFHAEIAGLGKRRMEREVVQVALDQELDVVGFAIDRTMYALQRRVLRWKQGFDG